MPERIRHEGKSLGLSSPFRYRSASPLQVLRSCIVGLIGISFFSNGFPAPSPKNTEPTLNKKSVASLDLNLHEAIRRALALNFQIKIEEFAPKIAKSRQLKESGKFDPTLLVSYTYDYSNQELRTLTSDLMEPTPVPGDPLPELFAWNTGAEADSSVAGLLPWGMTYDLGASVTTEKDSRKEATKYTSFTGLNLIQPLLKNFGTDVNLSGIRIARANAAISQWKLRQKVIDVTTETIFAYNDLYLANKNLEVEVRSRSLASQLVEDNRKRAEIGVMAPLDILQAQADLAGREERVLVAERRVKDAENTLKGLVSDEVAEVLALRVRVAPPPTALGFRPNLEKDFAAAFEMRPDYREALIELQRKNIVLVFNKNQMMPRLDLVGSLGVNGIDRDLSTSLQRIGKNGDDNLAWSAGAVFSVPIPNRSAKGDLQVAQMEIARDLVNLKRLEQSILLEADSAAGQIETTRKRIDATRATTVFVARTLQAGQARLTSGTSTTFEVLQFQRDLAQAQINEIIALTDHNKAIAEYARKTGTSLLFNRIDFE